MCYMLERVYANALDDDVDGAIYAKGTLTCEHFNVHTSHLTIV
jgi:hypothetical protein